MDHFGRPVLLNFNKKGDHHRTVCGGCCTLLFQFIIIWFLAFRIAAIVGHEDSRLSGGETEALEDTDLVISMVDARALIYLEAYDVFTQERFDFKQPREVEKYFTVEVEHVEVNINQRGEESRSTQAAQMRPCDRSDYERVGTSEVLDNALCMEDFDANFTMTRDSRAARKYMNINIKRCTGSDCATNRQFNDLV